MVLGTGCWCSVVLVLDLICVLANVRTVCYCLTWSRAFVFNGSQRSLATSFSLVSYLVRFRSSSSSSSSSSLPSSSSFSSSSSPGKGTESRPRPQGSSSEPGAYSREPAAGWRGWGNGGGGEGGEGDSQGGGGDGGDGGDGGGEGKPGLCMNPHILF